MTIRVVVRAKITDRFLAEIKEIYSARIKKLASEISNAPEHIRKNIKENNAVKIQQLYKLAKDQHALDRELTKLRSLPYTLFDTYRYNNVSYLYGKTKPITMKYSSQEWEIGEYAVYVPVQYLKTGTMSSGFGGDWHFIPFKDPKNNNRTPHHVGTSRDGEHPLSSPSSTCWGSFGSTMPSIVKDADIAELFRNIYIYIERYNPGSPLTNVKNMTWIYQKEGEEQWV